MSSVICTLQAPTLRAGLMTVASHMYTGTQAHKYTGTQYTVPRYTGGGKYFHSSLHPGHSLSSAKTNHKMSVFYSFFLTSRFWPRLDAPLAGAGVVAASTQSCKNRSTSMSMSMSMSPSTSMSISRSMRLFSRWKPIRPLFSSPLRHSVFFRPFRPLYVILDLQRYLWLNQFLCKIHSNKISANGFA